MKHLLPSTSHVMLGILLLFTSLTAAHADATSYFPGLTANEKDDYTDWVNTRSLSYPRHAFAPSAGDPKDGAAMFWNINGDVINFAVAVRAGGWVGFGISEAGGMIGSDVALLTASDPLLLVDAHVIEDRSHPLIDDCQDWKLQGSPTVENGWMIVEMSRLLDTQDSQDMVIKNDADLWAPSARIIVAWGDSDFVSYHGGKKARKSVRLFADHSNKLTEKQFLLETLEGGSDGHFDLLKDEYLIPAVDTTYHEVCRTFDDLTIDLAEGQDNKLAVIGFVPIITEETREFLHHFTVSLLAECTELRLVVDTLIYMWAPGAEGWGLPEDVGIPINDDMNNKAVRLEIHYDNPSFQTGKLDSSGVRFYFTHEEREHQAGYFQLGDPYFSLRGEEIDEGYTKYDFTCPGKCSSLFLGQTERNGESQGVTILSEYLHMHQKGVRMTHEVIRDGKVFHKAQAEVYDFDQQGGHHVQQDRYKVVPGDSFRTTCYYKDGSSFGMSSQEEMCIAYMMYYPFKQILGIPWTCGHTRLGLTYGCNEEVAHSKLDSVEELGRNFGGSSGECGSSPTMISLATQTAMVPTTNPSNSATSGAQVAVSRIMFGMAAEVGGLLQLLEQQNISHCTILLPSDLAITRDLDETDMARLLNPIWRPHLQDLLLYNVVEGTRRGLSEQLDNSDTASITLLALQGSKMTVHRADLDSDLSDSGLEKPTQLVNMDMFLYLTNRLFLPTSMTESLRELLLQDDKDQFSTFFELLQLVNLEVPLSTIGPITLFAPTNAAWEALDPALLSSLKLPGYRVELLQVLSRHVVWEENHMSWDWTVGETIHVLIEGESLIVTNTNPTVLNGTATITMPDVLATNGVMHVVDMVILPVGFELGPRVASGRTSNFGQHHPKANRRLNVVALGDSYIAGNGARGPGGQRDYTNALCYRSESSWPGLYATCVLEENAGGINVQFANHACSGSYISDLYEKQLSGITSKTDLVFLSIGGTDIGIIDIVPPCYTHQSLAECKERIEEMKELMKGDLKGMIVQLLLDIQAAGHSRTKIILTGFPYFGNDAAFEISNYPVGEEIYAAADSLELIQVEAAAEANTLVGSDFVIFESVKTLFRGKEFNADPNTINPESWMITLDPSGTFGFKDENYHYNSQGHVGLGNYLCTRSDYGASQPVHESTDGFSKSALLLALLTILAVSLIVLATLTYLGASHPSHRGDEDRRQCSKRWSGAIRRVHLPLKKTMMVATSLASTHPKVCIVMGIIVSLGLFACGLATNFNVVAEQEALWTPKGSRSESEGAWVESMLTRWSNDTSSILGLDNKDIVLTMMVHKKGKNMVTTAGAAKMFDALDAVRKTPGYSDFCAIHGMESACPPGYEYICKLYSIPTEGVGAKECPTSGATGFWFHNQSLYEEQVSSDADLAEAMSLDVFFGGKQHFNLRDVLGYPVYKGNLLESSTAFLSFVWFPKDAKGVENVRLNVVQALLKLQEEWKGDEEEYELQFLTSESFPDEFLRSIENDIVLFPVAFLFMSAFTCMAFARRDSVKSRSALGLGAVFTVLLSILTGYGILFTIGVPLTSLTQILPFVILGIGLDDSFLLKNAYERSDPNKSTVDRIEDTMDEVGISIAMTSFTSSIAFALGCFSSIPSVRWLCQYGFTTILVDFFYQITIFLALLVLDEKRIEASRRDILCCFTASSHNSAGPECTTDTSPGNIMNQYSKLLLRPVTKVLVIMIFSVLFSICAVATTRLEIGYDFASVLPADSYVISFENDLDKYTQRRVTADIYFRDVNQGDSSVQEQMKKYTNELVDGVDAIGSPPVKFWVTEYQDYLHEQDGALDGMPFNATLQRFLDDQRFDYKGSIILDDSGEIIASRTQIAFDNLDLNDASQVLALMKRQAKVTSEQPMNIGRDTVSSFFTFNAIYFLWDFLIHIEVELKMTTIIGVTSMSVMALIFLPHWSGILFVLPMIISLYVDMMGVLYLAGIDINGVSFVSIVMSLGLYVDYVFHVLLCYYESDEPTREEKVTRMLSTVAAPVLLGGLSTLFGTLPLAFTSSDVFYTVFIAFVAIVVLGLGHGLILLPILLSLVGPTNVFATYKASDSLVEERSAPADEDVLVVVADPLVAETVPDVAHAS